MNNNKKEEEAVKVILEQIRQDQLESISFKEKAALASLIYDTLLKQNVLELKSKRSPHFLIDHGYDFSGKPKENDQNTFQPFRRKFLPDGLIRLNDAEHKFITDNYSIPLSKNVTESLLEQSNKINFFGNFILNTSLSFIILSDQHASFAIGDHPIILGKEIVKNTKNITIEIILNKIIAYFYQTENLRNSQYSSDLDHKKFDTYSGYGLMPLSKNVVLMWEFKENGSKEPISLEQSENVTVEKISNNDLNFSRNFNFLMYLLSYKGVAVGNDKAWTNLEECYINKAYGESLTLLFKSIITMENLVVKEIEKR